MEQIFRIIILCVTAALLALTIRKGSPEAALLLAMTASVLVLLFLLDSLTELLTFLDELGQRSGLPTGLFLPLYKTIGIALVVRIGGSLCRDAGEAALASMVEMAGTVCVLLAALPLLRTVLDLLVEMLQ